MKRLYPLMALLFSIVVWGISFINTKVLLQEMSPVTIALFRQLPALVTLLVLMRVNGESFRLSRRDWMLFPVATLFGIVLYMVFENSGLQYTSASTASMLVAAIPVLVLLIESFTDRRPLKAQSLGFILASVVGVYFVLFETGVPDLSTSSFKGNLYVFLAMLSWIVYTFLNKRLGARHSSLKMTTMQTLFAVPMFFAFAVPAIPGWRIPSGGAMLHLLFLGIFCSALAYMFYFIAIQKMGPVIPSAFLNLLPLVTILTSGFVLHERLTALQWFGAALIIASLMALSFSRSREAAAAEASETAA